MPNLRPQMRQQELSEQLEGHKTRVLAGKNGILEVASMKVDWVMSAIIGSAGLLPGLTAPSWCQRSIGQ